MSTAAGHAFGWCRASASESGCRRARGQQRDLPFARWPEGERDGHGAEPDGRRADEHPRVAAERVVHIAAEPWAEGHAERGRQRYRAEGSAHDPLAEVLAYDDGVERHDAAIREPEEQRQGVE